MQLQVQISNKQILRIALPIAVSILVPNINFITNNIFLVFGVMGFGLGSGLQALMSRRAGENKADEIGLLFMQAVRIAIAFAATGILITSFIAPLVLKYALHNEQDIKMAIDFLRIRVWGLPFLYVYQLRNS